MNLHQLKSLNTIPISRKKTLQILRKSSSKLKNKKPQNNKRKKSLSRINILLSIQKTEEKINEKLEISSFAGICPQLEQTNILEYFFEIVFSQTMKSRLRSPFQILNANVRLSFNLFISRFSSHS